MTCYKYYIFASFAKSFGTIYFVCFSHKVSGYVLILYDNLLGDRTHKVNSYLFIMNVLSRFMHVVMH